MSGAGEKETIMTGIEMIDAERERQISQEGWTAEHDDAHVRGELATAATCYRTAAKIIEGGAPVEVAVAKVRGLWPWDAEWLKISPEAIKNYVKSGALYRAHSDRAKRAGDTIVAEHYAKAVKVCAADIDRIQEPTHAN